MQRNSYKRCWLVESNPRPSCNKAVPDLVSWTSKAKANKNFFFFTDSVLSDSVILLFSLPLPLRVTVCFQIQRECVLTVHVLYLLLETIQKSHKTTPHSQYTKEGNTFPYYQRGGYVSFEMRTFYLVMFYWPIELKVHNFT